MGEEGGTSWRDEGGELAQSSEPTSRSAVALRPLPLAAAGCRAGCRWLPGARRKWKTRTTWWRRPRGRWHTRRSPPPPRHGEAQSMESRAHRRIGPSRCCQGLGDGKRGGGGRGRGGVEGRKPSRLKSAGAAGLPAQRQCSTECQRAHRDGCDSGSCCLGSEARLRLQGGRLEGEQSAHRRTRSVGVISAGAGAGAGSCDGASAPRRRAWCRQALRGKRFGCASSCSVVEW